MTGLFQKFSNFSYFKLILLIKSTHCFVRNVVSNWRLNHLSEVILA